MEIRKNRLSYRIFFSIDSACLLLILVAQATAFYYFFNQPYRVLFVIMDVICIFTFLITMVVSYQYFTQSADTSETDSSLVTIVKKQLKKVDFGILPMSYVCWLIYVFILVWKTHIVVGPLDNPELLNSTVIDSCNGQNATCQNIEFNGAKWQKAVLQVCNFWLLIFSLIYIVYKMLAMNFILGQKVKLDDDVILGVVSYTAY